MPVHYTLDPERRILHTRLVGALTADDVRGHFDHLLADPALPERVWVLMDAMELQSIPTVAMLQLTNDLARRVRPRVRFEAVVVAVSDAAQYGMFRMGQVLLESVFGPTRVFRDLGEAKVWLESQMGPAA